MRFPHWVALSKAIFFCKLGNYSECLLLFVVRYFMSVLLIIYYNKTDISTPHGKTVCACVRACVFGGVGYVIWEQDIYYTHRNFRAKY